MQEYCTNSAMPALRHVSVPDHGRKLNSRAGCTYTAYAVRGIETVSEG